MMGNEELTYRVNRENASQAKADYEAFKEETRDPFGVNEKLLLQILDDNKDTEYGRKYGFADIKSYEDFRRAVPVITYDDISGYVDRMIDGEKNILTAYPYQHMNETSGTVGRAKRIPMTDRQRDVFMKYNKHYMDAFYEEQFGESWMYGRQFCTAEGATHYTAPSGITIGDASSVMANYVKGGREGFDAMLRTVYTSPVEATVPIHGTDTRYLHTRFALADAGITGIISGFYTMVVQYFNYISVNYEMLINDIEHGTIDDSIQMPEEVRRSVLAKLVPMPERAAQLREVFKNGSDFRFVKEVWPKMEFIFGVGGDGFSIYANTMRTKYVDERVKFVLSGITSSEGIWTVPVETESEDSVLVPGSAFMEFLPVEAGDDFPQCTTMDKLEAGRIYEIIGTTVCGLYRYRMSDAVLVTGYYNKTPRVRFMYRVNKVVNISGEKTSEKALQLAVEQAAAELGFPLSDFTVYPDEITVPARYVFLVQPDRPVTGISAEALAESIYKYLREENPEYAVDVDNGRMQKLTAFWLQPQTTFLWRDVQVAKGKSPSQFKPVRIITTEDQKNFFFILRDM